MPDAPIQPTWKQFRQLAFSAGGHPLTQLVSQRLGACIAYVALRMGLAPSALTMAGAVIGLASAAVYALSPLTWPMTAVLIASYQLAYGFDCADGQLARASRRASEFGAWFDVTVDFVRYIAIGYAVLVLLMRAHGLTLSLALPISAIFLVGTVVSLHTSISLQRLAAGSIRDRRTTTFGLRDVARTAIDTPFLLFMLCVLRADGPLLSVYVSVMGTVYLLVAIILANRRLRAPSKA